MGQAEFVELVAELDGAESIELVGERGEELVRDLVLELMGERGEELVWDLVLDLLGLGASDEWVALDAPGLEAARRDAGGAQGAADRRCRPLRTDRG